MRTGTSEDDTDEIEEQKLSNMLNHETLYLIPEDDAHPRLPLPRLPTCAVFHKLTAGRGVPHTFYGLLRKWPSLPRVVVSPIMFTAMGF